MPREPWSLAGQGLGPQALRASAANASVSPQGERGPPGVNGTQGFQGCPGQRGVKVHWTGGVDSEEGASGRAVQLDWGSLGSCGSQETVPGHWVLAGYPWAWPWEEEQGAAVTVWILARTG